MTSRTSNFSTHSYMSEASRSVANDLHWLEMKLAMVGNNWAAMETVIVVVLWSQHQ
jgi:hypothetical protein